jgi:hypothetical protein
MPPGTAVATNRTSRLDLEVSGRGKNGSAQELSAAGDTVNIGRTDRIVRPSCSTRPFALNFSPLAIPVILMVKSSVASAHPFGIRVRQDATAAMSPAVPTIDAGKRFGGPENLSLNGSSIVTEPGTSETTVMENSRTNAKPKRKDLTSVSSRRFSASDIDFTSSDHKAEADNRSNYTHIWGVGLPVSEACVHCQRSAPLS